MSRAFSYSLLVATLIFNSALVSAEDDKAYVDDKLAFVDIQDSMKEAEAWAMCASTYKLFSEIYSDTKPAMSNQLNMQGNGATLAVTMSLFLPDFNQDMSPESFDASWKMAQLASTTLPEVSRSLLDFKIEQSGLGEVLPKLVLTAQACNKNVSSQQYYIDQWREIAKSGLLEFPE